MSTDPLPAVRGAVASLTGDVAALRTRLETAASGAKAAPAAALSAARDHIQATIAALDPGLLMSGPAATVPLALLPVRIETRFADPGTDVLRVRIFPDDLHIDGHDPELTQAEADLGAALWAAPNDLPAAGETASDLAGDTTRARRALWAALVRLLGGPRAAWVARSTRPGAPTPAIKDEAYIRPSVARALPDRWLARGYIGEHAVAQAWSTPVRADLHLTPDPQSSVAPGTTGPLLDPELSWLVGYAAARAAGMAVNLPLPAGTNRLDRVVVVGLRATQSPADGAGELEALLTAHQYSDGASVLAVGSPTANTPGTRSAIDRRAVPDAVWNAEFGPSSGTGAAAALVSAMGLTAGSLDRLTGGGDTGDSDARAMQTATWAATWGYYLGGLMDPSAISAVNLDAVRSHYLDHVRGRGTLPTMRAGRQPYGLLPVTPLGRWQADGANPTIDALARLLQRVRPLWRYGVGRPVTAELDPGFDDAFSRVMSTDAVARRYAIRTVLADRTVDPLIFTGVSSRAVNGVLDATAGALLGVAANPLILDIMSPTAEPVRAPLVVDPTDPDRDGTVRAAITALAQANPQLVMTLPLWLVPHPSSPATLLHTLLRRSLLMEYAAAGTRLNPGTAGTTTLGAAAAGGHPAAAGAGTTPPLHAGTFVGLTPDSKGGFLHELTQPGVLSGPIAGVTGGLAAGEWLWRNPAQHGDLRRSLDEVLTALQHLAGQTADQLELLLPEALDLATHRYTAWAESIAAEKLARLRAATPAGVTLGGWAVVEALSRRDRTPVDAGASSGMRNGPLWADTRPGGFVHAPSTAQAATAAVLRAAHLAHGGDADSTFALDLTSGRARRAAELTKGVRAGQELGALLGYELERALHDRGADVLIAPLRAYAPRWRASGTFVENAPTELISPSAVVDGLALATDDPSAVAAAALTPATSALAPVLATVLAELRDLQDALADLFTAEAVHQVLAGNTARASGVLDAAHRGGLPPEEFAVIQTPRSGSALTCRIVLVMADGHAALAGGWPVTPRGAADPALARWLAGMLPALDRIRARVMGGGTTIVNQPIPVSAGLGPVDVVLDSPDTVRTRLGLAFAAPLADADRDPSWGPDTIGLTELLTVAADLREVIARRQLRRDDLLGAPASATAADERDTGDLQARLDAARIAVQQAHDHLAAATPDKYPGALASAFATGAVLHLPPPPQPGTSADAVTQADVTAAVVAARAELARRLALPAPAADADSLAGAIRGLLGSSHPALARFVLDPATSSTFAQALVRGDGFTSSAPELAGDWVDNAATVRTPAARLTAALQGCEALGGTQVESQRWRIIETATGASQWTAVLPADELHALGPVSAVVARLADATSLAAGAAITGLVADEWSEIVPQKTAATSVAYQAEAPSSRAGQAVLLGVAPDTRAGWDTESVVDVVLEALDLAQLRTVDTETGAWLGRMLPAVVLPDGDTTDVIAAPPLPLLQISAGLLASIRLQAKGLG